MLVRIFVTNSAYLQKRPTFGSGGNCR